ncbi:MAG: hypothetical protein H6721_29720 [Sandaracinus sp.]|nr:hypothetical protein [Sandaracinus sp.]MCB9612582.1 hypothetical protein [Sandaracinus sp.]MCB9623406.1 hypothetical protein [Sandaracinus sp.]MCB9636311.1 hypothetical protein [Sandaracinus sp.]
MQVDDRAPVPPTEEELRVERMTEEILASFEAALVVRLPFADDRRRVPELAKEARPAVASLHFALSVEVEGDEASLEHHEGLAMIHLLGRRAAVLGISPFSAAQVVDALAVAFAERLRALPSRLHALLAATLIEGFVRGREEVVHEASRAKAAASQPTFCLAPGCHAWIVCGDLAPEALEARGNELARELFAKEARVALLDVGALIEPDRAHAAALAETVAGARVVGVPVHVARPSSELREMLLDLGFLPEQLHETFEDAQRAAYRVAGWELREPGGLRRFFTAKRSG